MNLRDIIGLVAASESDMQIICNIQRAAFDSECRLYQRISHGGPDGYDTLEGLKDLMHRTDLWKIVLNGQTVGGAAVVDSSEICRLVRIFIDPVHQGKGIGHEVFGLLLARYPSAVKWELDTPSWSLRNHRFYDSLGFMKIGETGQGDRGFALFLYERNK